MKIITKIAIFLLVCSIYPFVPIQAKELPLTGTTTEACTEIAKVISRVLQQNKFKAATFAAYSNGKVACNIGLGFQDQQLKKPISPDAKMRIASVGKPVVAILIKELIDRGDIRYDTKVFKHLETEPLSGMNAKINEQVYSITIKNLLDHKLGWDKSNDGYAKNTLTKITNQSGEKFPKIKTIRGYMMTQKFQHSPGTKRVYSNFGYALLKEIVQKEVGKPYVDYLSEWMNKKYGVDIIQSLPVQNRHQQEIWYEPESPIVEFAFAISAKDLANIFTHYWVNGDKRKNNDRQYTFYGSWPGTSAILRQRRDGITYVLLINNRGKIKNSRIKQLIDNKIEELAERANH